MDIKPWDDETDMKAMEAEVRKIETDGLLWGAGTTFKISDIKFLKKFTQNDYLFQLNWFQLLTTLKNCRSLVL